MGSYSAVPSNLQSLETPHDSSVTTAASFDDSEAHTRGPSLRQTPVLQAVMQRSQALISVRAEPMVRKADLTATNGVVQVIDRVLLPPKR